MFVCESCGRSFTLPPGTLARYPGWRPKLCTRCRGAERVGGARASGGRSGAARGRVTALTPAKVLERYSAGPDTGVFTDGACSGNPGPGGWGAVRVRGGEIVAERHGSDPQTTNNRMELMGMIAGLEFVLGDEPIDVYSDSQLVVRTLTEWAAGWERRGWRRASGAIANLDLVQEAYALARARLGARIQWTPAHSGTRWNEYADALATSYLREGA